ncbi:PP2C family protein-serine/threonine phosphatase [Sphaerisporangium viridialbum]|uniref:PP2C family protein-serine/threonine phosphatase n=1 Tax=Sphaerisporangium viridialbum TaxID=46189 RepID=UPI003C71D889
MTHLDESVRAELEERDRESPEAWENFVTAVVLEIPDDKPVVHVIDCGHPPPLLIRDHHVTALRVSQPATSLGLGDLCQPAFHVETFGFEAGDTLVLYTDGVAEARCPSGAFYPLAERVATCPGEGPDALVTRVRDDLLDHVGGHLGDDAAMVAVHRLPD